MRGSVFKKKFFLGFLIGIVIGGLLFGSLNFIAAKTKTNSWQNFWSKISHYFKIQKKAPSKNFPSTPKSSNKPSSNQNNSSQSQNLSQEESSFYQPQTEHERKIIEIVQKAQRAVVSIIIVKEVPIYEQYYYSPFEGLPEEFQPFFEFKVPGLRQKGTKKQEVGGGTGFFVSSEGLILTNKHVVYDEEAEYIVLTSEKKKYRAKILAKDPSCDIAILKIEGHHFPTLKLGDSDKVILGQTVIAIGNALGEFQNSISVGVVSGLGRRITAGGGGYVETVENMIQTDAAINKGNSGGPLLNLKGEVIGINTAMASGAENIGFATPINVAKADLKMLEEKGKIVIPFLGVRYLLVNKAIKEKYHLPVDYGAYIIGDKEHPAIIPGSPAEKIGLKVKDIILEINGKKITLDNSLAHLIRKHQPGQLISLKVLRGKKIHYFKVRLGERSS